MSRIQWDAVDDRPYESGLDRGVLYVPNGSSYLAVPWNGLTAVEEKINDSTTPHYLDGVKYLDAEVLSDFEATLKAYTYPEEFEELEGTTAIGNNGLLVPNQAPKMFGLSYRTHSNDGVNDWYRIHILFNVRAVPDDKTYQTLGSNFSPVELSWTLSGVPTVGMDFRPTVQLILDSREIDPELLGIFEDSLYGTDSANATLLSMANFISLATALATIVITDNGDGTWSVTADDRYLTMLDATTFQIEDVEGTYLDPNTYQVQTTLHFDL